MYWSRWRGSTWSRITRRARRRKYYGGVVLYYRTAAERNRPVWWRCSAVGPADAFVCLEIVSGVVPSLGFASDFVPRDPRCWYVRLHLLVPRMMGGGVGGVYSLHAKP